MAYCLQNDSYDTVRICEVRKDGNCLFSSIAHQLFNVKLDSLEHVNLTTKLREETVSHIKQNILTFTHEIKGRIYEESGEFHGSDDLDDSVCQIKQDDVFSCANQSKAAIIIQQRALREIEIISVD